jgi:hypothetical protein
MKSSTTVQITFSLESDGETCTWSVDAVYDESWGGPVARDPYGNYYFYLTRQHDGRLYSSGTMLALCGSLPTDQYFTSDAQMLVDYRSVYDHNGSETDVDPAAGTIKYRKPKRSLSGTVKAGDLLFKADNAWDIYDETAPVRGTAYVFKRGCEPAPYRVSGYHRGWHTLVLDGPAPVREKAGCKIIGYKRNANATLTFTSLGD